LCFLSHLSPSNSPPPPPHLPFTGMYFPSLTCILPKSETPQPQLLLPCLPKNTSFCAIPLFRCHLFQMCIVYLSLRPSITPQVFLMALLSVSSQESRPMEASMAFFSLVLLFSFIDLAPPCGVKHLVIGGCYFFCPFPSPNSFHLALRFPCDCSIYLVALPF